MYFFFCISDVVSQLTNNKHIRAVFRVPVAPVGTNIHKKQDDSWLRPSETVAEIDGGDQYTHPYDQEKKKKRKPKSAAGKKGSANASSGTKANSNSDPMEKLEVEGGEEKQQPEKRQASAVNQARTSDGSDFLYTTQL